MYLKSIDFPYIYIWQTLDRETDLQLGKFLKQLTHQKVKIFWKEEKKEIKKTTWSFLFVVVIVFHELKWLSLYFS